ncbi:MAG: ribonuclease HII [Candidatus Marinimicrobia bacterium]|nr:ribonuclease HII [Candidatus Neomarinimicrobiota bacterium]
MTAGEAGHLSLHSIDENYRSRYGVIAGVDEAGRGPLAGPVTAAAAIFRPGLHHDLVRDSKKLSEKQREIAYEWITGHAEAWAVHSLGVQAINKTNILKAALTAMERAADKLARPDAHILVDGNQVPPALAGRCDTVVGGDSISFSIAAASILAKVSRDRMMMRWADIYPDYGFEKHKGYGTPEHLKAIRDHFPCPIHRTGFSPVKQMSPPQNPSAGMIGKWGENWAAYFLVLKGYHFITRNYHGGVNGEIDLIMKSGEQFIMVEVKTKFGKKGYDPVERIDDDKVGKMLSAAERYFYDLNMSEYDVRFDAVTVSGSNWYAPDIEHYEAIL